MGERRGEERRVGDVRLKEGNRRVCTIIDPVSASQENIADIGAEDAEQLSHFRQAGHTSRGEYCFLQSYAVYIASCAGTLSFPGCLFISLALRVYIRQPKWRADRLHPPPPPLHRVPDLCLLLDSVKAQSPSPRPS